MSREILTAIGLHLYQPPRRAFHRELSAIETDPTHINWTKAVMLECYRPLSRGGSLDKTSFDMYGVLREDLTSLDPELMGIIRQQMKVNGVGDSYLHPLLPDLPTRDQQILIAAGRGQYLAEMGIEPRVFWAPESALTFEVLSNLADSGYEGVICAPEQVRRVDGLRSDNRPTRIRLKRGRSLLALPFDRPLSGALAFGQKLNADRFFDEEVAPALSRLSLPLLIAWTDGETFGHHFKMGDKFLNYLLGTSFKRQRLTPVPIETLLELETNPGEGFLIDRTAWSCPHGDLVRWHGGCGCCAGDGQWKGPFCEALHRLNGGITEIVESSLPEYAGYLVTDLPAVLHNPGGEASTPEQSLLSAKASSLAALTSCGTFFSDPHVSGNINVLFGIQSLMHLSEAGFSEESQKLLIQFRENLLQMPAWTYLHHEGTVIGDFLA